VVGASGRFGLTEIKVGIPYPAVAMAVVRAELSPPVARRLVLRAELLDASTMVALGAFDEQVPDRNVVTRAIEVALELAAFPPATFELVKRRLHGQPMPAGWTLDESSAGRAVLDS
jgi:enoyl-CoA hydratase